MNPKPAIAKTPIGTATPAAMAGVLLFDCGIEVIPVAVAVAVDDAVDEAVFVAGVETADGDGEADVDDEVEMAVVKSAVGTMPTPRSQYLLKTPMADVFCAGSWVHSVETCLPIILEYLEEFW